MEPESISVERLDGEQASDYFVPHDPGSRTNDGYENIVEGVVDAGGVIAVELSYTSTLSVGWLNHHEAETGARTESTNHVALKLRLAKFLELKAFGYSFGLDEEACLRQDEHNPICARTRDYSLDGFYTIPYRTGSTDRVEVYKFEPTEKMPEADMQALSESALSVLDTDTDSDTQ